MDPLEAYNILLQRQMNEDRVLGERTSLFFLATSFLFLAFVMLLNPDLDPVFKVLRIILPIVGILLTFVLYGTNRAAVNASDFWHKAQLKIEEEEEYIDFAYMWNKEITPHVHGNQRIFGQKKWGKNAAGRLVLIPTTKLERWLKYPILHSGYQVYYLPPIFLVLWVAALVVAVVI